MGARPVDGLRVVDEVTDAVSVDIEVLLKDYVV